MRYLVLLCLIMGFTARAEEYDPDYEMRVSWVKTMKELFKEIEAREEYAAVHEKKYLEMFILFDNAWADSRYNCFYGGWPSILVKAGGKSLCQNPLRTNSSYDKGACSEGELQCQPLLFGKGLCVSSKTQAERNKTYANCESKFQKEHNGRYDFLKSPSRKEAEDLRELSNLAAEICSKKYNSVCKKINEKFPSAKKALDQAHAEAVTVVPVIKSQSTKATTHELKAECTDPTHEHETLAKNLTQVAAKSLDELYEQMKKDFQSSPFCDPMKVVNDPADRPSGFLTAKLIRELKSLDFLGNVKGPRDEQVQRIVDRYKLSDEVKNKVMPLINALRPTPGNDEERRVLVGKAKGFILQDFLRNFKADEDAAQMVKDELAANNVFVENEDGQIECPFVTKDAFMKAMKGHEEVLKKHGGSIKNKDQITIVDYSRPSNERRMFVIDLKNSKVLHNTWVAHGGGGDSADGVDGLGSSPKMSNTPGSMMSSDGFIIATQKAEGKLYGPNVLLRGIDSNNSNLAARAVVLHGWGSPMYSYSAGVEDYNYETETYGPKYDPIEKVKNTNFESLTTSKEIEKATWPLNSSTALSKYLGATEGCLGVPVMNVKHLDAKGRNKSQLELLREDLPGSVIFNYSGPDMKSKFF